VIPYGKQHLIVLAWGFQLITYYGFNFFKESLISGVTKTNKYYIEIVHAFSIK